MVKMLRIILTISVFVLITIISCHPNEKRLDTSNIIKQIEKDTGLKIPAFTSIKEDNDAIMGDYSYSFEMVFDSITFEKLIKQTETTNSNWISYQSGYRFDIHFSETNKISSYFLNVNKRMLFYLYMEE